MTHELPGRVRFHATPSELFTDFVDGVQTFLKERRGVIDVRVNRSCQSIIVRFDPAVLTAPEVVRFLDGVPLARIAELQGPPHQDDPDETAASWKYLGLSTAAVVSDLLFQSAFAPWLLAGAAIPIFVRSFQALAREGRLNVDVLDAAATTVLALQGQIRTAGVMVWLVSLGDVVRDLTLQQSHRALEGLFESNIQQAWVVRGRKKLRVQVSEIEQGDEVVVYPGELIPVDGTVLRGRAAVDQKILTGESMPVDKTEGDEVYAATVVRDGKLYLCASKVGKDTMVANVVDLIRHVPVRETRVQNYAEQFADRMVPYSFLAAGASYLATGTVQSAAALLIIDYGSGIRVAAPTTVLASMTKAARQGILVKGGRHLEELAAIDTIVFDKTGTLTLGAPEVVEIIPYGRGVSARQVLTLAAAAEQRLTHPMAEAIVHTAKLEGIAIPEREASDYEIGMGVEATVGGRTVLVGCHRFMVSRNVDLRRGRWDMARIDQAAASPVFLAVDGDLVGILVCTDPVRPEARAVVKALRARGINEIVMLTGDRPAVAKTAAEALGIVRFVADAFPEQKSEVVKALQQEGHRVAVVGDGINDSPALACADVGIAVNGGADVARETAHVAVLEGNLWKIPQAIDIARGAMGLIKQNWDIIAYPNTAAIALSLFGLLGPVGATLLSNGAGILASLNALRPMLGTDRILYQGGDELLEGKLRRSSEHDGAPLVSTRSVHDGSGLGLSQVAPGV